MYDILQLNDMLVPELKEIADKLNVKNSKKLAKQDLVLAILDAQATNPDAIKKIDAPNEKTEVKVAATQNADSEKSDKL